MPKEQRPNETGKSGRDDGGPESQKRRQAPQPSEPLDEKSLDAVLRECPL